MEVEVISHVDWNSERHEAIVATGATLTRYLLEQVDRRPEYVPMLFYHRLGVLCRKEVIHSHDLYEWHALYLQSKRLQEQLVLPPEHQELLETMEGIYQNNEITPEERLTHAQQIPRPSIIPSYPSPDSWISSLREWTENMPSCATDYQVLSYRYEKSESKEYDEDTKEDVHLPDAPLLNDPLPDAFPEEAKEQQEQAEQQQQEQQQLELEIRSLPYTPEEPDDIDLYLTSLLASSEPNDRLCSLLVFPLLAIQFRKVKDSFLAGLYQTLPPLPEMNTWEDMIEWITHIRENPDAFKDAMMVVPPAPPAPSSPPPSSPPPSSPPPSSQTSSLPLMRTLPFSPVSVTPVRRKLLRRTSSISWPSTTLKLRRFPSVLKPARVAMSAPYSIMKHRRTSSALKAPRKLTRVPSSGMTRLIPKGAVTVKVKGGKHPKQNANPKANANHKTLSKKSSQTFKASIQRSTRIMKRKK
jgi:hypothetical protein